METMTLKQMIKNDWPAWRPTVKRIQALTKGKRQNVKGFKLLSKLKEKRKKLDKLQKEIDKLENALKKECTHPPEHVIYQEHGIQDDYGCWTSSSSISITCKACDEDLGYWINN